MPILLSYLLKLSVSLGVVFIFYHFVLRRLTHYTCNRWYLVAYTLLSFLFPLINSAPALESNNLSRHAIVNWAPAITYTASATPGFTIWNAVIIIVLAGMGIMLVRLLIQLFSFRRMLSKAKLKSGNGVKIYQVADPIIPFSFGNAIFINHDLHSQAELEKIVRHEFIHVKQGHSFDILWSELLCLVNWYNPFAWMIRAAIRQNLEFIADEKVIEKGFDKKQYQYLLLKVIGNKQFSIASNFNFSSLKKRIAMMNKTRSGKVHLLRFLFLLPVMAAILISFRGNQKTGSPLTAGMTTDTVPKVKQVNSKGYLIDVVDQKGHCLVEVKDSKGKLVEKVLLNDWKENQSKYDAQYGEIPPPPPPAPPAPPVEITKVPEPPPAPVIEVATAPVPAVQPAPVIEVAIAPVPAMPPAPVKLPGNVKGIEVNNNRATVILKNGDKESYDLDVPAQKKAFEKKYGEVMPAPPAPPAPPIKKVTSFEAPSFITDPLGFKKKKDNC